MHSTLGPSLIMSAQPSSEPLFVPCTRDQGVLLSLREIQLRHIQCRLHFALFYAETTSSSSDSRIGKTVHCDFASVHERSVNLKDDWAPQHLKRLQPDFQPWLHRGAKVQQFVAAQARRRMQIRWFCSSYARTGPRSGIQDQQTVVSGDRYLSKKA